MFITGGSDSYWVIPLLFDPIPKDRIDDFYDFRDELRLFVDHVVRSRLTVVSGLRRTGKTSLVKVGLSLVNAPYIYLDTRFTIYPGFEDIARVIGKSLEDSLRRYSSLREALASYLKMVKGVAIGLKDYSVSVVFRGGGKLDLQDLFLRLNEFGEDIGSPVILVFDEAQDLRKATWARFDRFLAYVYDNLKYVNLTLTGSQFGILKDFLGLEDPEAPLYGRPYLEIKTRRLSESEGAEFLRLGFEEARAHYNEELIREAVSKLDGIIGWLTFFGYSYITRTAGDLEEVYNKAVSLAGTELTNLLSELKSSRYRNVLKTLSTGGMSWSELKKTLERVEGRTIEDKAFNEVLRRLSAFGLIEKVGENYVIIDPIYRAASTNI